MEMCVGSNSFCSPIVIHRCTVVEASNFYSVVTRTNDNALIGEINLSVRFDNGDPNVSIPCHMSCICVLVLSILTMMIIGRGRFAAPWRMLLAPSLVSSTELQVVSLDLCRI